MKCKPVAITTPFIKLDAFLKLCGEAGTGGHAKVMVLEGLVQVDGAVCTMRGKKLYPGSRVEVNETCYEVTGLEGS